MPNLIQAGIDLIKRFESCKLIAYPDPASDLAKACAAKNISIYDNGYAGLPGWQKLKADPWTIGWGSTGPTIRPGIVWTQEQADAYFSQSLREYSKQVSALTKGICLSDAQFSALVSWAYNVRNGNLRLKAILSQTFSGPISRLTYVKLIERLSLYNRGNGEIMPGLVKRRAMEKELFLSGFGEKTDVV